MAQTQQELVLAECFKRVKILEKKVATLEQTKKGLLIRVLTWFQK
jgi:hypothetical protein